MRRVLRCFLLVFLFITVTLHMESVYAVPIRVNAVSAIAIDRSTGMILFDQNAHKVIPMASTTKIITALITLEYGNLDRTTVISKNAAAVRGSKVGYKAGDKVTIRELLYGLMLKSGNDCAIAIAEDISGNVEKFCQVMNEYAVSIGLLDSHFESPHGLDSNSHYSTAYDLAIATKKAKEIDEFNKIVSTKLISEEEGIVFTREFSNINKLLYQEPNCTGVKTGYTGQAGKCLVSSFKVDKNEIIVVTLNCVPRWRESIRIYEYVRDNYAYNKVIEAGEVIGNIKVKGRVEPLQLIANEDLIFPVKIDENLSKEVMIPKYEIETPIRATDDIGIITITNELNSKYSVVLHPSEDIENIGLWQKVKYIFHKNK